MAVFRKSFCSLTLWQWSMIETAAYPKGLFPLFWDLWAFQCWPVLQLQPCHACSVFVLGDSTQSSHRLSKTQATLSLLAHSLSLYLCLSHRHWNVFEPDVAHVDLDKKSLDLHKQFSQIKDLLSCFSLFRYIILYITYIYANAHTQTHTHCIQ